MDRESNRIARRFAAKLRKRFKIDKVIFFGSRARGDHFKTSDFDFVVVSDDFKDVFFTDRIAEASRSWDEKFDVEPLCYTTEEFARKAKQHGIIKKANEEGIEI